MREGTVLPAPEKTRGDEYEEEVYPEEETIETEDEAPNQSVEERTGLDTPHVDGTPIEDSGYEPDNWGIRGDFTVRKHTTPRKPMFARVRAQIHRLYPLRVSR